MGTEILLESLNYEWNSPHLRAAFIYALTLAGLASLRRAETPGIIINSPSGPAP
ncbi:hypothetical protein [Desulfurococcus amylolyticus]|uniref:hypothetical protein n=1 Tax=Desulfurococcus amylolyticus TaxID=94694 RepID=UPI000A9809B1|nr:hypothetical protein [Desulfurococcus amylolyticus]